MSNVNLLFRETIIHLQRSFFAKAGMPSVIGCIDGFYVPMIASREEEWVFVNRKNQHSINVQAVKFQIQVNLLICSLD